MSVRLEDKAMVPIAKRSRAKSLRRKIIRARNYHLKRPHFIGDNDELYLARFAESEWGEYGYWLYKNRLLWQRDLLRLYETTKFFSHQPLISIIMPVHNPKPHEFEAAVRSVLWQAYANWELWIVDDGSTQWDYLKKLKAVKDKRVHYVAKGHNEGIAATCQHALDRAAGDFVAVLDQDDELYLDALFDFASVLQRQDMDYFFSDRDMLSPGDKRYMHFFKPGWSPEYLLSFNYIQHFEIFRTSLVREIGGFDSEFEGSQDYDLTLRVTERTAKIYHQPNVLYSWRQSEASVAQDMELKAYAYEAGINALKDAVERRGLPVADVEEYSELWRGHYRMIWDRDAICDGRKVHIIPVADHPGDGNRLKALWEEAELNVPAEIHDTVDTQTRSVRDVVIKLPDDDYVLFCDHSVVDIARVSLLDMLGYLEIPEVGATGCKHIDTSGRIHNVGLSISKKTKCLFAYRNSPIDEPGYGAICTLPRNVSLVYPACWATKVATFKEVIHEVENPNFALASADFFMRLALWSQRTVIVPETVLKIDPDVAARTFDVNAFLRMWHKLGLTDPYYNPNLTELFEDFGINAVGN